MSATPPVPHDTSPHFTITRNLEDVLVATVEERDGNVFQLGPILRKYCGARLAVRGSSRSTTVPLPLLYDALGLLRSLVYDAAEFNRAAAAAASGAPLPASDLRYACYRLTRQAAAFGVRVPRPGTGSVEVPGLDALVAAVEREYADALETGRAMVAGGVVDFASLPVFFTPGADVLDRGAATGMFGLPTGMRCRACYVSRGKSLMGVVSTVMVAVEFVVNVGDRFAVVEAPFPIAEFNGTRSTTEGLESFVALSAGMRAELERRGARYEGMGAGAAYMQYAPGTFLPVPRGVSGGSAGASLRPPTRNRAAGRVMVDSHAAWSRGVHCARSEGVAAEAVKGVLKLISQRARVTAAGGAGSGGSDSYTAGSGGQTASATEEESLELLLLAAPLPPSLLALTWPAVAGFSFASKAWGVVAVSGLAPIDFNVGAFDRLVMPAPRKALIKALVLSHGGGVGAPSQPAPARFTADVISGKGEGTVFLLHGPPGVGKTLTAEAIAELLHRPLYVVSFGELGTQPETLEERLRDILDLAELWGALVLVDEAEMLLEARSKSDVLRNSLVCVMLRLVEFFSGILFLTTNRVTSLDPAFQSRVTCALRYAPLDAPARREIWTDLLGRHRAAAAVRGSGEGAAALAASGGAGAVAADAAATGGAGAGAFGDIDVHALAAHPLNGRQIKNAMQLGAALAASEGSPCICQRHLDATLELTTAFLNEANE